MTSADSLSTLAGGGTAGLIVGMALAIVALVAAVVHLYRKVRAADRAAIVAAEARRVEEKEAAEKRANERIAELRQCVELSGKALEVLQEFRPILEELAEAKWQRRRPSRS